MSDIGDLIGYGWTLMCAFLAGIFCGAAIETICYGEYAHMVMCIWAFSCFAILAGTGLIVSKIGK